MLQAGRDMLNSKASWCAWMQDASLRRCLLDVQKGLLNILWATMKSHSRPFDNCFRIPRALGGMRVFVCWLFLGQVPQFAYVCKG